MFTKVQMTIIRSMTIAQINDLRQVKEAKIVGECLIKTVDDAISERQLIVDILTELLAFRK